MNACLNVGADGVVVGLRLAATKESNLNDLSKIEIMRSYLNAGIVSEPYNDEKFLTNPENLPSVKEV